MESMSTLPEEFSLLRRRLVGITDQRYRRGRVHPLDGVLALTIVALMCGQRSLSAIYRFGDTHPVLLGALGLRRSPSVATLSRLLRMVSVSEVREALLRFVMELSELRGKRVEVAAMDRKTVRGVWEDGEQLKTLHIFSREGALALDQMKIDSHSQEPRAALMWVKRVSSRFEGLRVLTGDALYAHADLAEAIMADGKDYVVKLKKNRPELYEDVELLFAEPTEADMELTNKGHGRLENRKVWVSEQLAGYSDFPGLSSAIKIAKRLKRLKDGSVVESVRYAVSSLSNLSPSRALSLVRGHWGIEKVCSMSKTTAL